jgi:hypothetical protein
MSNHPRINEADRPLLQLEARLADQKAYLDRLTVQGAPTQAATDVLNKLSGDLRLMKRRRS